MSNEKQVKDNYTFKIRMKSGILFVVCLLLTFICLIPIWILIVNATRESTQIQSSVSWWFGTNLIENIKNLPAKFPNFHALIGFRNSAIIAVSTTFLSVFFSALTAYGLYVYDFKIKSPAYTFILGVMMVPMQVTSIGFMQFMVKIGLNDSYIPLIVPAIAAPAIVFFMRQYLQSSLSLSLIEAARIDGCGEFRTFLQIAIPLMKPAIAVQAIFAFIANWNNFYQPSMILTSSKPDQLTLPMMINGLQSNDKTADYGVIYYAIALSILPLIIAYLLLSKFIVAGDRKSVV